ncbi:hypothetical protein B0T13DRAFT_253783 [Neurospora crassa]|nr:hypothetical protein B0T13DRAFT_253783 [Neurospora crassa]
MAMVMDMGGAIALGRNDDQHHLHDRSFLDDGDGNYNDNDNDGNGLSGHGSSSNNNINNNNNVLVIFPCSASAGLDIGVFRMGWRYKHHWGWCHGMSPAGSNRLHTNRPFCGLVWSGLVEENRRKKKKKKKKKQRGTGGKENARVCNDTTDWKHSYGSEYGNRNKKHEMERRARRIGLGSSPPYCVILGLSFPMGIEGVSVGCTIHVGGG